MNAAIIYSSATGVHRVDDRARWTRGHPASPEPRIPPLGPGGIIVPPGYSDPVQFSSRNPCGTSHVSGGGPRGGVAQKAACHQARRAVDVTASLKTGRAA